MHRYRLWAQSILIAVALGLWPQSAYACLCPPPVERNPQALLNKAAEVFLGRVVETRWIERRTGLGDIEVVVEVERVWKGAPEARKLVYTDADTGLCGFPFRTGERYLIYAEADEIRDQLWVEFCGGTLGATRAQRDLEVLGEGTMPVAVDGYYVSPEDLALSLPPAISDTCGDYRVLVERTYGSPEEARLLRIAEALYPPRDTLEAAIERAHFKLDDVPDVKDLWWSSSFDGIRILHPSACRTPSQAGRSTTTWI